MCGITGTIFTKELNLSSRVDPLSTLASLVDSKNIVSRREIDKLLKFSVMYKSDINFLNYFESKREQQTIKKIVKIFREKYGYKKARQWKKSYAVVESIREKK